MADPSRPSPVALLLVLSILSLAPAAGAEPEAGRLEGRVALEDGTVLEGVRVVLDGTVLARTTSAGGHFAFAQVPPGTYTVTFTLAEHRFTAPPVDVVAGATLRLDPAVPWKLGFADTLTVRSVSRRPERMVDAPAAVTLLTPEEIARQAAGGQLPELLEFTPGAELTQGGLWEFNLNVRGMNDVFNRRLLTLIDGRDTAVPSLGSQEWAALSLPLDELASVELVRGPGSALYGADAFNGVLNLTTKAPRDSLGGQVRLTAGELAARQLEARYATALGGGWYLKGLGGVRRGEDFSRPRLDSVEYAVPCVAPGQTSCLPLEAVAPDAGRNESTFGALRLDKHFGDDKTLVVEGGTAVVENPVGVTEFGRLQMLDVERPWARFNFSTLHWNVLGSYTGRDGKDQIFLSNAYPFVTSSDRTQLEVQGRTGFAGDRGYLVAGASLAEESLDSADSRGVQTVTWRRRDEDFQAAFGQVEWAFTDRLEGVLAARWDRSSFYDGRLSPRASLVWAVAPDQTLRLSFSEAFLSPSYVQLALYMPVAPPLDLSPFEAICAAGGASCGFEEPVALRVVGNRDIEPEEIRAYELGYSAVLGNKLFLTADVFHHRIERFISDFVPYVDPFLGGRLHPSFPAYRPPSELPPALAELLLQSLAANLPPELFAVLSNGVAGEPLFPLLSVTNFGRVDTRGLELGLTRVHRGWTFDFGYRYYDFDVREDMLTDPALPNTSEHRVHAGITYVGQRFDAAFKIRYVDGFPWSSGFYRGRVPSYDVADVAANYRLNESWSVGINVSNLFDNSHFEFFGADLLQRRALAHLTFSR